MIDVSLFENSTGIAKYNGKNGGQELILHEIAGLIESGWILFFPFYSSGTLVEHIKKSNQCYWSEGFKEADEMPRADCLYFGTPTIVNDAQLFDEDEDWTKKKERATVRRLCREAERLNYKRIISGLGSGDIEPDERIKDMGGGKIICMKKFKEFTDWIIVRDL